MLHNPDRAIVRVDGEQVSDEAPLILAAGNLSPWLFLAPESFYSGTLSICSVVLLAMPMVNKSTEFTSFMIYLPLFLVPFMIFVTILYRFPLAVTKISPKACLILSEKSLKFSRLWWHSLLRRPERSWDDLHSVSLIFEQGSASNSLPTFKDSKVSLLQFHTAAAAKLCFDFRSGGSAQVQLALFTRAEVEELLKTIERYGDPSKFSSELVKLERALFLEQLDNPSFTQLWTDDLNSSYVATNYLPLRSNQRLQNDRYTVLMEMAAGGMSAVYLALDENKNKVVLKETVIPENADSTQKQKSRELFEREANLLLRLSHPQIAKILDRFIEQDRDYIVLQFIPGMTLKQLVKCKGQQNEEQVLDWARQICEILTYLHSQNPPIVHRDLSPDNLILTDNGAIMLIDFGAANELVTKATGTMIGKQCYMAPEQLQGKADCQSDLYALGATLHYLLTGVDPVPLSPSRPGKTVANISPALDELIWSLTNYESYKRPQSADSVLELIKQLIPAPNNKHQSIASHTLRM